MTVIQTTTKYRCDGCGYESEATPNNWKSLVWCGFGSGTMTIGAPSNNDYCGICVGIMLDALVQANAAKYKRTSNTHIQER